MKVRVFTAVMILTCVCAVNADQYNWTGAVDNDVFNELNWELDGSPGTDIPQIDPAVAVNQDLVIASGTPVISGGSFATPLQLGETLGSLTITGGYLDALVAAGNNGIRAQEATGTFIPSVMQMSGTAQADLQFILDLDVTLSDSSLLVLGGGGNPVNRTGIDFISPNASVHFLAETVTQAVNEHLGKFTVFSAPAVIGLDATVLEPGDSLLIVSDGGNGSIVTTPIPEPATMVLLGLGGLLGLRRRK